jgi:hypothetical protein
MHTRAGPWTEPKTSEESKISQCLVADASASILLSLWDTQGDSLQMGDIIRLSGGYVKPNASSTTSPY